MSGIFGWMTTEKSGIGYETYSKGIEDLFLLSETRGKEASGLCGMSDHYMQIVKADTRAKKLVKSVSFSDCVKAFSPANHKLLMGHTHMVTDRETTYSDNNQSVIRHDLVMIYNGIIVNEQELWKRYSAMTGKVQGETEILAVLMEKYDYKKDLFAAFRSSLREIEGSVSVAIVDRKSDWLILYTNTGSLYVAYSKDRTDLVFASERYILERFLNKHKNDVTFPAHHIQQIEARKGLITDLLTGKMKRFCVEYESMNIKQGHRERKITETELTYDHFIGKNAVYINGTDFEREKVKKLLNIDLSKIRTLKRCTKCVLPETFPGITFDRNGVCSICNNYKRIIPKGKQLFINDLNKNHTQSSRYDCIVPISGGRDSCYIIHYLVKELHLKPVAYTYDWGLVTDLARRNIQRMCAALGVEHILISADINKKRYNVRQNVEAWLKHPELSTVPLFMAGDKQFFYYAQLLKRQMHVDNVIFGMNALEETQFKARFVGLRSGRGNDLYYNFSMKNKLNLFIGYGKEFIRNPAYINTSLLDSFTGFLSFYVLPQRYLRFFNYIPWDQKKIEDILINEYNWETAGDTTETWRIGDGTAPFYNYIYYKMAGFTEFDTFKSNQIREKMMTREEALQDLETANQVSLDGFLWYCRTIGIDPIRSLKIINHQKPLYET